MRASVHALVCQIVFTFMASAVALTLAAMLGAAAAVLRLDTVITLRATAVPIAAAVMTFFVVIIIAVMALSVVIVVAMVTFFVVIVICAAPRVLAASAVLATILFITAKRNTLARHQWCIKALRRKGVIKKG